MADKFPHDSAKDLAQAVAHTPLDDLADALDRQTTVQAVLNELPEREREVVRLLYLEELSREEVAKRLSLSPKSVGKYLSRAKARLRALRRAGRLIAFGLAALLAIGLAIVGGTTHRTSHFKTAANEWQTQVLSDGTSVELGPRTDLLVDYTWTRRGIHLSSGEAMFVVAKNPLRPFVVDSQGVSVRAVGTRFAMSTEADRGVVVTVEEGRVAVTHAGAAGTNGAHEAIALGAGEQLSVDKTGRVEIRRANVVVELAWRNRQVIFVNDTIAEAVDQFNRRNAKQISVLDPTLISHRVTGTFHVDEPDDFVRFLASQLEVTVKVDESGTLLVMPRSNRPRH